MYRRTSKNPTDEAPRSEKATVLSAPEAGGFFDTNPAKSRLVGSPKSKSQTINHLLLHRVITVVHDWSVYSTSLLSNKNYGWVVSFHVTLRGDPDTHWIFFHFTKSIIFAGIRSSINLYDVTLRIENSFLANTFSSVSIIHLT